MGDDDGGGGVGPVTGVDVAVEEKVNSALGSGAGADSSTIGDMFSTATIEGRGGG